MSRDNLQMFRWCALLLVLCGCQVKKETPQQRYDAAKVLFEETARIFHLPSAQAEGAEKDKLQSQAAAGYQALLSHYPDQDYWAAQALRSLGNICATQGKLDAAIHHYAVLEKKYPQQDWELLMAWKSAADLWRDAGRHTEARACCQKIVARFDRPDAPQVVKTIVRGCRTQLAGSAN
jgi:tetratricopeptide (TPR) repeat protein